MPKNIKIQINPEILTWAREEAGYMPEDIASKLHITKEKYAQWESEVGEIPLGQVREIANYYKRQLAVFLLPSPPPRIKKPNDYRNLAISHAGLSHEVMIALRRTTNYLALAKEILGDQYWQNQYQWQNEVQNLVDQETNGNDLLINWLRQILKIDINRQKKFRGNKDAFRQWRNSIEQELGIFIFQFDMPEEEIDGFCYAEEKPPYAIVVNKSQASCRKIFTIFHELRHILGHQSGICLPEIEKKVKGDEQTCNNFAGEFLVPNHEILPVSDINIVSQYAWQFKVSREVYLYRSYERHLIDKSVFSQILKEIRESSVPKKKPNTKEIRISPTVLSKSTRGEKFYNLILDAVYSDKIDYLSASDALGMGYSYIAANE